jgi:hypothetical protein
MSPKTILLGVAIAVVLAGVIFGAQFFFSGPTAASGNAACGYDDCPWTGSYSVKPGGQYPGACPRCGRQSVCMTTTCAKCGNKQVLNGLLRSLPGYEDLPDETRCEKCGEPLRH